MSRFFSSSLPKATHPISLNRREAKRLLVESLLLFIILAVAILYGVKSWQHYFFNGLAEHWDPKTMGEWMAWNAHNILHGNFLLPDYHANFFYPHSYTLAFGELLWPESFLYALFYFLTGNLFFSFNGTMLFFWALSGVLLFLLLRSLDISPVVSAFGGLIYCLMPYRMPYYVEFNMVLVFIFPLMILLLLRWLRNPSIVNTLWFCLGYLVSATSCLYFTIMAIIVMGCVSLSCLAADRTLLKNRQFYLSGALLLFGVIAISIIYLYPYALLRIEGGYKRSMADYLQYFAQPMQYLDSSSAPLLKWLKIPHSRFTETFLFPGTVLSLLFLGSLVYRGAVFLRRSPFTRISGYLGATELLFWAIFWSVILVHAYLGPVAWLKPLDPFLYHLAFLLILCSIAGLFVPATSTHPSRFLLAGLAAAAVVTFFVSFGPFISVGPDKHRLVLARGPFMDLASWNPLFSAVRSLTRFSIVILTYLAVVGCVFLDSMIQKNKKLIWVVPVLVAMLVYEARHMIHYKFENCSVTVNSHVINTAQNLPGEYVLFQIPIDNRFAEANIAMSSIGKFPLLIDGWSGFVPEYYRQLLTAEGKKWDLEKFFPLVSEVWPDAYLIIDRAFVNNLEKSWLNPFPWQNVEKSWELMDADERFALYRPKRVVSVSAHIVRRVRTDILKAHPILSFAARRTEAATITVSVSLNGRPVKENIRLSNTWQKYTIALPEMAMGNLKGEEIHIDVDSASSKGWEIGEVGFEIAKEQPLGKKSDWQNAIPVAALYRMMKSNVAR